MPHLTIAGRVRARRRRRASSSGKPRRLKTRALQSAPVTKRAAQSEHCSTGIEGALFRDQSGRHIRTNRSMASKKVVMVGNSSIQDGKPEVRKLSSSVLGFWSGGTPNSDEDRPAAALRIAASKKPITTPPTASTYQSTSNSVRKLASRFERASPDVSNDVTSSSSGSNTSDDSTVDRSGRRGLVTRKRSCNRKLFPDAVQSSSTESSSGILETTNDSSSWASSQDIQNSSGVLLHESGSDRFSTPENSLTNNLDGPTDTPIRESDPVDRQPAEETRPDPEGDLSIHSRGGKETIESSEKLDPNELAVEELTPVSFDPGLPSAFSTATPDPTATTTETISSYFPPTNNDTDFSIARDMKPDTTPSLSLPIIEDEPPRVLQREDAVEEEKEEFFPPTNDSDILVADSFSVKEGNEEDTQAHDINKSEYSEGILYNLIHAAQAAVEKESQVPSGSSSSNTMKTLTPLEPSPMSSKRSQDVSSVAMGTPSVIGESSTMTRGGETVIRSNRSNRPVPQLVPSTSDAQSDRVGQALADALERSLRDNPEYLSESSISGTESVTSGDTSDLENFLGSFMTDFVGTNNRMQCGSSNHVVENKKPAMPSLLEIKEYLNKEKSTEEHEGEENSRADNYYSKRVLGDHLSEATSQVESHLDSATWDTEANDTKATSKSDTTHGYTPTQWFETIQKTILSITSATAATPQEDEPKKAPSNFADSFDTLDEIMQALQGSPPLSTRGRQSRDSSLTEQSEKRETSRLKTPTKQANLKNRNTQQQPQSYSSTPLKPPPSRRPGTDTDSTEKPSDSFRAADNSLLQKSLNRSFTAPSDSTSTGSHTASGTNDSQSTPPSARKQIDEIYSVMQKSRDERGTETPPKQTVVSPKSVAEKQQGVRALDGEHSADQSTLNGVIQRRSRRKLPRINVTKRSEGNEPEDSVLSKRPLDTADGTVNKADICPPAIESLDVSLPSPSLELAEKTGGDMVEEWQGPHWHTRDEVDPNDKSESGLTILGQEWVLQQSDTDVKSTDTADGPSTVSLDAPVVDSSLIHSDRSVPSSEGFHVFVQEQQGEGDLSSILNVDSSMGSESNDPFATPKSPQKTERATAAPVSPDKNNPSGKKVLKRLGNMIFTRGPKNASGISTSEADTSTESPTNEYLPYSTFDPLTTDSEVSRTNDTSSCSSTDPRQKQAGRWLLRLSAGKTPVSLLEHEDEMTRASGDTAKQPQREENPFADFDWSATGPMEPQADRSSCIPTKSQKLHVDQEDTSATKSLQAFRRMTQGDDDPGWEEFSSAVPFKQLQSTKKPSVRPWQSFTPKPTARSPPPKLSQNQTSFLKPSPSLARSSPENEGWEDFFGSGSFQRGYEV